MKKTFIRTCSRYNTNNGGVVDVALNVDNITDMHQRDNGTLVFFISRGDEETSTLVTDSLDELLMKIKRAELDEAFDEEMSKRVA